MSSTSNVSNKRALLIGIDEYRYVPPLDGCINDVRLMHRVLVDTFAFAPDDITLLTNGQATRAAILAAFDALVAATSADDIVVIYYAGHGSRMTDREGDEPSGFDSTILPVDSGRSPHENRDITDDEIHVVLAALAAKTSYVTVVVDACHSGTITRDAFGTKVRGVTADRRAIPELPPSPFPGGLPQTSPRTGTSSWLPLADSYVLIAGCRDEQVSYEYRPPEAAGAVAHGALTYFLCDQLRRATPGTSYRDVFERAAARVTAEHGGQHPQMEGRADGEVFGVADLTPMAFVPATAREGPMVTMGAGAAHGVTVGSTYAMYPQGTKVPAMPNALGNVRITAVGAVTAQAHVDGEVASGAIGPGARGFETAHAFGDFALPVQCADSAGFEPPLRRLKDLLARSTLLKVVSESSVAAARVYLLGPRSTVSPTDAVPQVGALDTPRWAVVGATGDLLMPLKTADDAAAVVDNLETLARYRQALALENPDPRSRLRGRFTLDLLRLGSDGTWSVARPEIVGGHVVFDEGDAIGFRIESRHDEPVHIALLDFGLSGVISQVFPPPHAQDILAPGISFEIGTTRHLPLRLTWPTGHRLGDATVSLPAPEGCECVKLFITRQPADLLALEQPGVRTASAPRSPLASLLRNVFHGAATRGIVMSPVGTEDWTTVTRSFVLKARTLPPSVPRREIRGVMRTPHAR